MMRTLLTLITFCMSLLAFSAAGDMRGFATVANDNYQGGIVTLSPTTNKMTLTYGYYGFDDGGPLNVAVGGYDAGKAVYAGDGKYLVFTDFASKVAVKLNISDGKIIANSEASCTHSVVSLTYDYATDMIYGCFKDGNAYILGKFDPKQTAYTVTKIADCERYVAMAAAVDGTIYAINGSGKLIQMDKDSGDSMEIGATGRSVIAGSLNCAAIDWNTGKMYWQTTGNDVDGIMYSVNTSNGSATRLYTYGDWHALLAFDFEYTYSGNTQMPPSAPTNLSVNFTGASKSGNVSFKAPTTLADGNKGTGALTYKVMIDGAVAATGETTFGANVTKAVSVTVSGEHRFAVTVANANGESNAAEKTAWIGYDQPQMVSNIVAHYADGKITLAWNAPTAGVHGGYFNAAKLTYKVYRGETLVATVNTCTATDNVGVPATPTPYIYYIVAELGDAASEAAQSRRIFAGAYNTPMRTDFNSSADEPTLDDFNYTVINGGDEDYTWRWRNNAAQCPTYGREKADDWLITPPVHLVAGTEYRFRFDACCGGTGANAHELFNVYYGTETTAEAMTTELIATTDVSHNNYQTYSATFKVDETGDYCIGIHCLSDIHYYLQVDNIAVREENDYGKPAAANDLVVTPDYDGALKATVQFTIPSVDEFGDPITGVDQVKVYRDEAVIYRSENGYDAGATFTYSDEVTEAGYHTYVVATVNKVGQSGFTQAKRYIGANIPTVVRGVNVSESEDWGTVNISWTAPETDVDGYPINPALIQYDIYNHDGRIIADNVTSSNYVYHAIEHGLPQAYMGFRIVAKTAGGKAEAVNTGMLPVGDPFKYPYTESFADKQIHSTFAAAVKMGAGGFAIMDDSHNDVSFESQDGDNGFMCIEGTPSFDTSNLDIISIHSGKIEITGNQTSLSFYYKGNGLGSTNSLQVYICEWNGANRRLLTADPITTNVSNGWERVQLPISEWRGKVIRFEIEVYNVTDRFTYLDNIRIEDANSNDLMAYNFTAPAKARAGESLTTKLLVQNVGSETANGWSVVLKRDGNVVWTQPGIELESGKLCLVYLYDCPPVFGAEQGRYVAEVVYDKDECEDNNVTEEKIIEFVMPEWPAVTQIKGEIKGDDYVIQWTRPVASTDETVTDSFEDYYAWEKETIGDWHLLDYDGLNTAGMLGVEIPVAGTPCSFYVFNGIAHTGNQCLCAFSSTRGDTEDWLISPVLNGDEQTISFWEAGFNAAYYPETYFEVYYSTTDNQPWSFMPLTDKAQVSVDWTKREVKLPAGTKYFAIICTQTQMKGGAMFLDDITYVPATHSINDLRQFKVYRDGAELAEVSVDFLTYTDKNVANDESGHSYFVTALYDKGESVPSPAIGFGANAITAPVSTVDGQQPKIYDLAGRRVGDNVRGILIINGTSIVNGKK